MAVFTGGRSVDTNKVAVSYLGILSPFLHWLYDAELRRAAEELHANTSKIIHSAGVQMSQSKIVYCNEWGNQTEKLIVAGTMKYDYRTKYNPYLIITLMALALTLCV